MSMTVEQFLSFSESEQLQTVKELNDTGNVKTIIDVLIIKKVNGRRI